MSTLNMENVLGVNFLEIDNFSVNEDQLHTALSCITNTVSESMTKADLFAGDSLRLFHSRGQSYEALNWCSVDYFDPVVIITLFRSVPESWQHQLSEKLVALAKDQGVDIVAVVVQDRTLPRSPFNVLLGELPEQVYAKRKELTFLLSFNQQNLGFFLDIEPARVWLENHTTGKKVLNLFAFTCAFSVVAKAAKAHSIVNIDLSKKSLAVGQKNHRLNGFTGENVSFLPHDIFKSWGKLKKYGPYDIVIIDPPSFQKGSFIATKDYEKVLRRMSSLVTERGLVLTCLNSPEISLSEFKNKNKESLGGFSWQEDLAASDYFPEKEYGRGLKMVVYKKNQDI